jgi:hypothetical protein
VHISFSVTTRPCYSFVRLSGIVPCRDASTSVNTYTLLGKPVGSLSGVAPSVFLWKYKLVVIYLTENHRQVSTV